MATFLSIEAAWETGKPCLGLYVVFILLCPFIKHITDSQMQRWLLLSLIQANECFSNQAKRVVNYKLIVLLWLHGTYGDACVLKDSLTCTGRCKTLGYRLHVQVVS